MAEKKTYEYVLSAGTVLKSSEGEYTIKKVLGQGGFGITYQARGIRLGDNVPHKYAIKEFFVKGQCWRDEGSSEMRYSPAAKGEIRESIKDFKNEALRLNQICRGNRNIVNVNEVFEANDTVYYVMEYLEGGSLRDVIRNNGGGLSEGVALSFIRPIAEAVEYIHSKHNLLHCDIKPDNIMLRLDEERQPLEPVLIDFGISVHFKSDGRMTTTHNALGIAPGYSPQEQYQGIDTILNARKKLHEEGYKDMPLVPYEMDVYALGATLYCLLTGANPPIASYGLENVIEKKLSSFNISDKTRKVIVNAMRQSYMDRTKTASLFLKGFEDRYYLPKWYVLRSSEVTYQIVSDLREEKENYLCYDAVIYTGTQQDRTDNATIARRYTVYELFRKGVFQRQSDESLISVASQTRDVERMFLSEMQRKVGFNEVGKIERNEAGTVIREIFSANGTIYAIVWNVWKMENPIVHMLRKSSTNIISLIKAVGTILRKNAKAIGKILALVGIIALLCIGGYHVYSAYQDYSAQRNTLEYEEQIRQQHIADSISAAEAKMDTIRNLQEAETEQPVPQIDSRLKSLTVSLSMVNKKADKNNRCYVKAIVSNPNSEAITTSVSITGGKLLQQISQTVTVPANGSKVVQTYFTVTKTITASMTVSISDGSSAYLSNVQMTPYISNEQESPKKETNAEIFAKAKHSSDWNKIEELGRKGYSPAYITLAQYYFNMGYDGQCEKWARKAIFAGVNVAQAQKLLEELK